MAFEVNNFLKKSLTDDQITYILSGERKANELAVVVTEALGQAEHTQVESKRQTIIEGPPAVGKSFTTKETCKALGVQPIEVTATSTPSEIAAKFAYADYWTPKDQEIVVIYDDADEAIFGEKKNANTWKRVFTDDGDYPEYNHNVNMTGSINAWRKDPKKARLVEAVTSYITEGALGITVPMDRFRHIVLTNTDWETEVEKKSKAYLAPVIDRFKYTRLKYEWTTAWGWLSYVLLTTQPFEDRFSICLTEEQKVKIIVWIFDHWDKMGKKQTYRTVKEMAEYLINEPDNAHNRWQKFIRTQ